MALVKVKPTSAGRRGMVKVVSPNLHKGAPHAALLEKKTRGSGRNNNGHIKISHRGGGHQQHYRVVDFRRHKYGNPNPKRGGEGKSVSDRLDDGERRIN